MSKLGYGGLTAGIGMLIVFLGLTILVFCIMGMGAIFKSIDKKKAAKAAAAAPAPAPAPIIEEAPAAEEEVCDDAQLIAVISAAIAAYDNSGRRLAVRKVRRVSSWNNAARDEQIFHF